MTLDEWEFGYLSRVLAEMQSYAMQLRNLGRLYNVANRNSLCDGVNADCEELRRILADKLLKGDT